MYIHIYHSWVKSVDRFVESFQVKNKSVIVARSWVSSTIYIYIFVKLIDSDKLSFR